MRWTPDERFFRREHARLVAMLARRFGTRHLDRVEDAVQRALLAAAESWPASAPRQPLGLAPPPRRPHRSPPGRIRRAPPARGAGPRALGQGQIHRGLSWLARSAEGEVFTRYHAEAGIAAEHCLARSFAETRRDRMVSGYQLLERLVPAPLHTEPRPRDGRAPRPRRGTRGARRPPSRPPGRSAPLSGPPPSPT